MSLKDLDQSFAIHPHVREITTGQGGINLEMNPKEGFLEVAAAFAKKVASKVLSGQFNFSSMQRPSLISNPESHLQLFSREFSIVIKYVHQLLTIEDSTERLKLLVSGIIGNLTLNMYNSEGRGPLNPLLGETYAAKSENGDEIYLEQLSMSPFTCFITINGAKNKFLLTARIIFEIEVGLNLNSAVTKNTSVYQLKINDGTVYSWSYPVM